MQPASISAAPETIMAILSSINLPWPILVHALGITAHGLSLIFKTPKGPGGDKSIQGIALAALGMTYIATSYVPLEENQFLHAAVPIRLALGVLATVRWITTRGRDPRLYDSATDLLLVALSDGLGGAALGWYLGSYSGRTVGFR